MFRRVHRMVLHEFQKSHYRRVVMEHFLLKPTSPLYLVLLMILHGNGKKGYFLFYQESNEL